MAMSNSVTGQQKPQGFLVEPKSGTGPGVLVLHAWWGLNDDVKDFCRKLAANGFAVFAPDMFEGKVVDAIADAEALANESFSKLDEIRSRLNHATTFLAEHTNMVDNKNIRVVGFSFGAYFALELSNSRSDCVSSVVVFYGTGYEDFSKSKASYMGHFAENDPFEPTANVEALEKLLHEAGRPATVYTYPGMGHWFFEPSRLDAFDESAANLAWERTLDFLKKRAE